MKRVNLNSEIGRLKRVILHEPGEEIELITPHEADEQHFIDIVHYEGAKKGHEQLRKILSLVADEVYSIGKLLLEVVADIDKRNYLIDKVCTLENCMHIKPELMELGNQELSNILIKGLVSSPATLTDYLINKAYTIPPLPNLYFVRDIAMAYRNKIMIGSMANKARMREAVIVHSIFAHVFDVGNKDILVNGTELSTNECKIEGGDFHVITPDIICIGLSERTSSRSVDMIIDQIHMMRKAQGIEEPFNVIAVMLPRFATTIHLDMVFSQIDVDYCVIYPPVILKPWNKNVIRVKINPDGKKTFYEYEGLLPALKKVGIELTPVFCGGEDPMFQQREQWSSGCNFFAFAPGKAIGYDMNQKTLDEFSKAGFRVVDANHVIKNPSSLKGNGKIIVTINGSELARGSGGCRCMTLPLERAEVKL